MLELFDTIENYINQIIVPLNWLMLVLIIGGGIYLTFISRANPLIKINQGFRLLLKKTIQQLVYQGFKLYQLFLQQLLVLAIFQVFQLQFTKAVQVFLSGCGLPPLLALQLNFFPAL